MDLKMKEIKQLITRHNNIALFHHVMIDGDSLASSYGLAMAIKLKYPQKNVVVVGNYDSIQKRFEYLNINKAFFVSEINDSFLAIVGDCAVASRIEHFDQYQKAKTKIVFDHHQNKLDFQADIFWHEPSFIASSMQACLISEALEVPLTEEAALHLVHGIITDSGRFHFSGADHMCLSIAAKMYQHISDKTMFRFYEKMHRRTLKDLKFQAWVFSHLQIKEQVGYVIVTKQDQLELGLTPEKCTRVNLIANIENQKVWIMFIEYPEFIRVELRSSGVPVNKVAMQFNGGGHIKAAGCRLSSLATSSQVVAATITAVKDYND